MWTSLDGSDPGAVLVDVVGERTRVRPLRRVAAHRDEAGDRGHGQDDHDDGQRERDRHLGHLGPDPVRPVQHQLEPDEDQDERQPGRQVDQPVEQAVHEEEQGAQAQQGERVRDEHDVRLVGHAVHGGDRVQREQDVGGGDGDERDEQRRGHRGRRSRG